MTFNVSAENKIVLFGDSLMAGYGLQAEYHLSRVLENSLATQGFKVKVELFLWTLIFHIVWLFLFFAMVFNYTHLV